ncbi:MAG: M23 family metallopeptidase [Anaeromyxobacteraceae bacterium]
MPLSVLLALALAAPSVRLAPPAARPGDAVLVTVLDAPGEPAPQGTLAGRALAFWRDGQGWRALAALPIETAPGEAPLEVTAGGEVVRAALLVVDPRFPSKTLRLPEKYVHPPKRVARRQAEDRAAFAAAYDRAFEPARFQRFAYPREADRTGRFGDQRLVNGTQKSVHYGLDLDGAKGAPVAAAADGVVVLARDCYLSGNSIVLSHGAGAFTAYFHLSRMDVKVGDAVRLGDRIGLVGATGRATGPHLHWSAKVSGLLVDPESLVFIDFAAGTAPPREPRAPAAPPAPAAHAAPEGLEATPPPPPPPTDGAPAPPR